MSAIGARGDDDMLRYYQVLEITIVVILSEVGIVQKKERIKRER